MLVHRGLPSLSLPPAAVTIGNFDGIHQGHRAMVARLKEEAAKRALETVVLTFEPHPRTLFNPDSPPARLGSLRDKLETLEELDVDHVVLAKFNRNLASLDPEAFMSQVLRDRLNARHVLVGHDFRFGARRAGSAETLVQEGPRLGFDASIFPPVERNGTRISSTGIRELLSQGELRTVAQWLGHPYTLSGRVRHGQKLGRTLGFPTLNLSIPGTVAPLAGIFAVSIEGLGPQARLGVASLGQRPTVEQAGIWLLEVHVFEYDEDCYGQRVHVRFHAPLRQEKKFDSLEALTAAMERDRHRALAFFEQHGPEAVAGRESFDA